MQNIQDIQNIQKQKIYIRVHFLNIFHIFWKFEVFDFPETFLLISSSISRLGWSLSNRRDEVSMCHFLRKVIFVWKTELFVITGPRMVRKEIQNGVNIILKLIQNGFKCPPHPQPRRQQKSPARGQHNWKTFFWWFSMIFMTKKNLPGGFKRGQKLKSS